MKRYILLFLIAAVVLSPALAKADFCKFGSTDSFTGADQTNLVNRMLTWVLSGSHGIDNGKKELFIDDNFCFLRCPSDSKQHYPNPVVNPFPPAALLLGTVLLPLFYIRRKKRG